MNQPTPVEVLAADAWWPGTLDRWRLCERRGWIGHVWWRRDLLQHVEWIPADRLRKRERAASPAPGKVRR